ncbi:MAG: right-handed parallel beta-helix repeat-containing protein [Planctomycetota bacterium]
MVQGSAIGVLVGGDIAFTLEDSTIEGSVFRGLQAPDLIGTPIALAELNLVRSRVLGTVGTGIEVGGGFARVRVEDCLIEGSQQDGLLLFSLIGDVDVDRTTIARNGGSGLYLRVGAPNARVRGCVLAANAGPDVRLQNTLVDVRDSLVEDGSATGPGVLAGDPLFVDLAARDFRLRPSSPAVDVLAPSAAPDLDGVPRDADGDLDLVAWRDMGALELAPLRPLGPAVAGTDLELELIGPDPGMATIAISPVPLVAPAVSPYGALALDPVVAWRALRVVVPGGGVPALARLPLPSISVGETWGVQALLPSAAAPAGGAFSNPLEIEIE